MGFTLLVLGIVLAFFFHLILKPAPLALNTSNNPYYKSKPLTHTEQIFYHRLLTALPEYIVLSQVQLSRFIKVKKQSTRFEYNKWFYPIAQQSVDYLICGKDFSIIAAVELDDKSHQGIESIKRDQKKSLNLELAEVKLIRWHAESMPSTEEIRASIVEAQTITAISADTDHPLFMKPDRKIEGGVIKIAIGIAALFFILLLNSILSKHTETKTSHISTGAQVARETRWPPPTPNNKENHRSPAVDQRLEPQQHSGGQQFQNMQHKYEAQQRAEYNRQQLEAANAEMQERQAKEAAWERFYKKRAECENPSSSAVFVECGNDYMRAKQRFEQQWQSQKQQMAGM